MTKGNKEQLSEHVETIFKRYSEPGLHICDIATGGGKSYTIAKLICEYYPSYFDRIIVLCVKNELVKEMQKEINKFATQPTSKITTNDLLLVETNIEVTRKAIRKNLFSSLFKEMERENPENPLLTSTINKCKRIYKDLSNTINNELTYNQFKSEIDAKESELRYCIGNYFKDLKWLTDIKNTDITIRFPSLIKIFPQTEVLEKKVILTTIHKTVHGIDPILTENLLLKDLVQNGKKTLLIFDESDQCAVAMRDCIVDNSVFRNGKIGQHLKGYDLFLHYKSFLEDYALITNQYMGEPLKNTLRDTLKKVNRIWEWTWGDDTTYNNILLSSNKEIETYRRGVFFIGEAVSMLLNKKGDNTNSYICHKKGDNHFILAHGTYEDVKKNKYERILKLSSFIKLCFNCIKLIKSVFTDIVLESLNRNKEEYDNLMRHIGRNKKNAGYKMKRPNLKDEIHTFFTRFNSADSAFFEQELFHFITTRKNIRIKVDDIDYTDLSAYAQGIQLFQEEVDLQDNLHHVRLSSVEISQLPERIIADMVMQDNTSVVLCSATASSKTVISNFDLEYLKNTLGYKFKALPIELSAKFDDLNANTYPKGHTIRVVPLEKYESEEWRLHRLQLPERYKKMFCKDAQEDGSAERWFKFIKKQIDENQADFQLNRLFQFIEAYHFFITHGEIQSMLYFQNMTGEKNGKQINVLSSLIDGSYKSMPPFEDELPTEWSNKHIYISKNREEVEANVLKRLSENKDEKIMLVAAYGSFKAGSNLHYKIPKGMKLLMGDSWEKGARNKKKDWDAIYLQTPTCYLSVNGENEQYEKSFVCVIVSLAKLWEKGCISKVTLENELYNAFMNQIYFSEKHNPGVMKDKSAWMQSTLEQAIGRLCRTRNKAKETFILYDSSMVDMLKYIDTQKSLTKEFKEFVKSVSEYKESNTNASEKENCEESVRCINANNTDELLDTLRSVALRYTVRNYNMNEEENTLAGDVPLNVTSFQNVIQTFKQTIIKHPVIHDARELGDITRKLSFITKCYGNWPRNEENEYSYYHDKKNTGMVSCKKDGRKSKFPISPATVRLDLFMKNNIIREHFERNEYATEWKDGGLILNPNIMKYDYAGEIGEEAFKALIQEYCNVKEEDIVHLAGYDYELADFVLKKTDGSYKIAFDVKNMRNTGHTDKRGDLPTNLKRELKTKRLHCPLITINMLKLNGNTVDALNEIDGLLNEDGSVIPEAISQLNELINN